MPSFDIALAFALILAAIVVFILSRVGIAPSRSAPVVIAAFVGAFGISVFRNRRMNALEKQLAELNRRIAERDKELERLREEYDVSDRQLGEALAKLDHQLAAAAKEMLLIDAQSAADRGRIETADFEETLSLYRELAKRREDGRKRREAEAKRHAAAGAS